MLNLRGFINKLVDNCNASSNQVILCDGEYIKSEGLCLRHACLFDVWIAEGGFRVYGFKLGLVDAALDRWRRYQYHKWLNKLTIKQVEMILS